ncbi:MAG: nickel-dependent lactate racemase, partial [Chloroflexi bacterium]|nr:nickel-dependent lactate racemase [Chloroflexota bacterium]
MTDPVSIPWGKEIINLSLPSIWQVTGRFEPSTSIPPVDVHEAVKNAINGPVMAPALRASIKPGMHVAIVIDDLSRPTPVSQILPIILDEITSAGVNLPDITVVPALGVHRPMSEKEVRSRMGDRVPAEIKWESHDCDNPEKMKFLGTTSRGTPVWINRTVTDSDLIISIGCIEPHIIASFGGGYKNIVPGVAGRLTIAHNHAINCQPGTFNMVGQPIEINPMRLDLEEAAGMMHKPVFIINAVLNSSLKPVRFVAGDPVAAHREGCRTSSEIYSARVPQEADVVITSSNPMDSDLRQGVKALANTIRAVRRGGVLIVLARAEEGLGVFGLANKKLPVSRRMLKLIAPIILPLVPKLKLKNMGE